MEVEKAELTSRTNATGILKARRPKALQTIADQSLPYIMSTVWGMADDLLMLADRKPGEIVHTALTAMAMGDRFKLPQDRAVFAAQIRSARTVLKKSRNSSKKSRIGTKIWDMTKEVIQGFLNGEVDSVSFRNVIIVAAVDLANSQPLLFSEIKNRLEDLLGGLNYLIANERMATDPDWREKFFAKRLPSLASIQVPAAASTQAPPHERLTALIAARAQSAKVPGLS